MVALMVMEHQMQMHNYITLANYETRKAIAADQKASEANAIIRANSATRRGSESKSLATSWLSICCSARKHRWPRRSKAHRTLLKSSWLVVPKIRRAEV
jgi:nitrate reductase beta subunit